MSESKWKVFAPLKPLNFPSLEYGDEATSDVHFTFAETPVERVPAHKFVLAAKSEVFSRMFFWFANLKWRHSHCRCGSCSFQSISQILLF